MWSGNKPLPEPKLTEFKSPYSIIRPQLIKTYTAISEKLALYIQFNNTVKENDEDTRTKIKTHSNFVLLKSEPSVAKYVKT